MKFRPRDDWDFNSIFPLEISGNKVWSVRDYFVTTGEALGKLDKLTTDLIENINDPSISPIDRAAYQSILASTQFLYEKIIVWKWITGYKWCELSLSSRSRSLIPQFEGDTGTMLHLLSAGSFDEIPGEKRQKHKKK